LPLFAAFERQLVALFKEKEIMEKLIWEGEFWKLIMVSEFTLPGYSILASKDESLKTFARMSRGQSSELGYGQALACRSMEACLFPRNVVAGRYGLVPGYSIHYHIVPIYEWVIDAFNSDSRYTSGFDSITPEDYPVMPDGAALLAFVWRELCARKKKHFDFDPESVFQSLRNYVESEEKRDAQPVDSRNFE